MRRLPKRPKSTPIQATDQQHTILSPLEGSGRAKGVVPFAQAKTSYDGDIGKQRVLSRSLSAYRWTVQRQPAHSKLEW